MKFPSIGEIATRSVICIEIDKPISEAIKMMFDSKHRNIIVVDGDVFRILTVNDVLNIKIKKIDPQTAIKELKELAVVQTVDKDKSVLTILNYLNYDIGYLCVVDSDGSLYGVVSHTDIIESIDPESLISNLRLDDFLKLSQRVRWIDKNIRTIDLLQEMANENYESIIVIDGTKPVGIFTAKDILNIIKQEHDLELPISCYMSSPIESISNNCSVKEALEFLKFKHYKRVVVVDGSGNMSGIITQKELISLSYSKWAMLMKEHQEELSKLNVSLLHKSKKYEEMASTDPLTGLYNRRKFLELYASSLLTMEQRDNSMSLLILDLDHFKRVNDTYGHSLGDQVLIQISNLLIKKLRNIDIVCRWGGEEFVVLFPAVDLKNALFLAEKLRISIEVLEIDVVGRVTASFGVTEVIKGESVDSAIERADKAMYMAKESGRNCVRSS
jgi:diguanylate cyclase (GGDEF)-like protein